MGTARTRLAHGSRTSRIGERSAAREQQRAPGVHGQALGGAVKGSKPVQEEVQMRLYRASFVAGFAAGFVAGARSGKETYDQIVKYAKTAFEHPAVQQARGTVQTQAQKVGGQLADKMPQVAQSAAHSVTDRIPGMRSKADNGDKTSSKADTSAFATSSGPAKPGSSDSGQ
jgi:hypothetical protein